ncbi:MAG TPA: ABC transporter substrate-binding protein [Rhodospirillaceae bacterium]|nr:MAG: peptide ABC transporter substrate-binding protein [Alphaproteobacteria bacterium GWF2_58_20]HAU28758.1 ABC transporter substrate-binding protein [Rhodospirillaceae bacterium]
MKKIFFILALLAAFPARAATHGIAMQGEPKYPVDFTHLDYVRTDAPKGGLLKDSVIGTFDSLNAFSYKGKAAAGLYLTYDTLMARIWDEPFSLYGLVAESVDMPEDRSSITFTLRPEARFHDGISMTVDDVLFTWQALKERGRPNTRRIYGLATQAEKVGDRSIRFTFGEGADRETPLIFAMMPVLPKKWWQGRDISETTLDIPLGSGPYRILNVDPGRSITYERIKDWWGKDLPVNVGLYNFHVIRYDYYRDDGVALEAFKAGELDIRREWNATKWASSYDFPAVRDGRIIKENLPHGRPEWMRGLIFNTRKALFSDVKVREALTLCLDFEWMNKTLFSGIYKRISSYYPNSVLAASGMPSPQEQAVMEPLRADLPPEAFGSAWTPPTTDGSGMPGLRRHLRKAVDLLKQAGWEVRNERLVNVRSGEVFAFEILLSDPADQKVALEFARALERLGIEASVRVVDSAEYTGRMDGFDFDMTLGKWISTLSPGAEQLLYWGSAAADTKGSKNWAGIRNPAIDALAASIPQAMDRETLVARAHALDRALTWGYYSIPLYYLGADRVARWSYVRHPENMPLYGMVIESWWTDGAIQP